MSVIINFLIQVLLQVLLKLVVTVFSKEMIGKLMFACLHRLVKLTVTTKDDGYIDKLENMYWDISDTTDAQSTGLLDKIKNDSTK